jgi:hypothetical protein
MGLLTQSSLRLLAWSNPRLSWKGCDGISQNHPNQLRCHLLLLLQPLKHEVFSTLIEICYWVRDGDLPTSFARTLWKLDLSRSSDHATASYQKTFKRWTSRLTQHVTNIHNDWASLRMKSGESLSHSKSRVTFPSGADLQSIFAIPLEQRVRHPMSVWFPALHVPTAFSEAG